MTEPMIEPSVVVKENWGIVAERFGVKELTSWRLDNNEYGKESAESVVAFQNQYSKGGIKYSVVRVRETTTVEVLDGEPSAASEAPALVLDEAAVAEAVVAVHGPTGIDKAEYPQWSWCCMNDMRKAITAYLRHAKRKA